MEKQKEVVINERIPTKEKVCYGIGGFMDGGGVALMSCIMLKYMTSMGVAMAVASTIMTVAKLWDAVTDPLMGFISDNTRSKWGRRKPYMFVGGILLIVTLFIMFMPIRDWGVSVGGFTAFILIMYLVWNTVSTVTQVPYCSMSSDISPSFKERNNANTVKLIFTSIASGLAYALPLLLIEAMISADGYLFMPNISATTFWLCIALIFGILFGGGLILCGIVVKERVTVKTPKEKFNAKQFVKNYAEPYKNRSYRWHIGMYCAAFTCMDMLSALAVYYATDVWHGEKLFGMDMSSLFIIAPLMVAAVCMFPVCRILMDKKSKQFVFRMGLPFYIIGGIMFAVMDPSWTPPILVPIMALFMGLGFGGAQMIPWMIFPDTIDVAELATGKRPTGTYSGMMTLARKVSGAFGVGLVGWILGAAGYKENTTGDTSAYIPQEEGALLAIKLVMGISVAVLISFAFFASFRYKVTNKKLARIKYFNEKVEKGEYETLTEEEKLERIQLINQLAFNYDEDYDLANVINRPRELPEDTPLSVAEEEIVVAEGVSGTLGELAEDKEQSERCERERKYASGEIANADDLPKGKESFDSRYTGGEDE